MADSAPAASGLSQGAFNEVDIGAYTWIGKRDEELDLFAASCIVLNPTHWGRLSVWRRMRGASASLEHDAVISLGSILSHTEGSAPKLIWYDELWAHDAARAFDVPQIATHCTPEALLRLLGDKIAFRRAASAFPLLRGKILAAGTASYARARMDFPEADAFVVHGGVGSACSNNRLILRSQDDQYLASIQGGEVIVTPLIQDAIPLNVHMFVGRRNCIVAPPSVQLIKPTGRGRLFYGGCDFASSRAISAVQRETINALAQDVGVWLRDQGYSGVAGLDLLVKKSAVTLVEINARFQASTCVLNAALYSAGLPICQALHVMARRGDELPNLSNVRCDGALLVSPAPPVGKASANPAADGPRERGAWDSTWRSKVSGNLAREPLNVVPHLDSLHIRETTP